MIPFDKNTKPREIVPTGNHVARLYSIVQIGHVPNTYPGKEGTTINKVQFTWELLDETREFDGVQKPLVIGGEYTVSLGDKSNLLPIVEGIIGKLNETDKEEGFDFETLLGKACMVNVLHDTSKSTGREYAYVASTAQLPKKMEASAPFNSSTYLDYFERWDQEVYEKLPQWLKDKMMVSTEMRSKVSGTKPEDIDPFAE